MILWLIIGAIVIGGILFALALGASSAKADRMLGYKDSPSEYAAFRAQMDESRRRTFDRLGIQELPPHDGHVRVGLENDSTRRRT